MPKKDLTVKANVTAMAINSYEKDDRKSIMDILKALVNALDVWVSDFLAVRNDNIGLANA